MPTILARPTSLCSRALARLIVGALCVAMLLTPAAAMAARARTDAPAARHPWSAKGKPLRAAYKSPTAKHPWAAPKARAKAKAAPAPRHAARPQRVSHSPTKPAVAPKPGHKANKQRA